MPNKLLKSTSLVASFTLLSRLAGFMRDIILASIFGATGLFDAFIIAFKLPNFLRRLFGEGAFSQAFIPMLAEYRAKHTKEDTQDFVNHVTGTLAASVFAVVILFEIAAPLIIMIFAPGFLKDPARYAVAVHMLRIISPYLLLIVLTALAGAILNTFSIFAPPAFAPVMLNVALIAVSLWWAPYTQFPIYTLGVGVLLGGILQLIIQLPYLKKIHLLPKLKMGFKHPGTLRVMKRMIPALFGVSIAQISILIDNVFASFLQSGSISWLYYSDRLIYFPLGVIGVALATVVMPHLSKQHATQNHAVFSKTLEWALKCTLLIGIPSALGLFVLAKPILMTILHYGKFNYFDVIMTAKSLCAYAIGLPAFMLIKILASAFYSKQNIKTPVKIAGIALLLNILLNFILIHPLKHAGLALSTSIAASANALILFFMLIHLDIYRPSKAWVKIIVTLVLANVVLGVFLSVFGGDITLWLSRSVVEKILHLLALLIGGVALYFAVLRLSGIRWQDFKTAEWD